MCLSRISRLSRKDMIKKLSNNDKNVREWLKKLTLGELIKEYMKFFDINGDLA